MRIKLLLFGAAGAAVGGVHEGFVVPDGAAAGQVADALSRQRPEVVGCLGTVAVAVNRRYVRADHVLRENDEVALIPPVSGG